MLAIALYEYGFTLSDEVAVVWQRRLTATSAMMLSIRWVMLLLAVLQLFPITPKVSLAVQMRYVT